MSDLVDRLEQTSETGVTPELIDEVIQRISELEERYNELLYAVACKFPGESRHETALRYINERESCTTNTAMTEGEQE